MKYQVLISLKNNEKKYSRLSSAAVVIDAIRVKIIIILIVLKTELFLFAFTN